MSLPTRILRAPLKIGLCRKALRRLNCRRITILMYHGIPSEPPPVYNWCHLPVLEFDEQMRFLSETYRVLPLADVVDRMEKGKPLPASTACITFDDAFRNVQENAVPILRELELPATIFVVTGLADEGLPPWPERLYSAISDTARDSVSIGGRVYVLDSSKSRENAFRQAMTELRRMTSEEGITAAARIEALLNENGNRKQHESAVATMTWPDIELLARSNLIDFGAHTRTHTELPTCSVEQQRLEIQASRDSLRKHIDRADLFAYPNGRYTKESTSLVRELGFTGAVTVKHGLNRPDTDRLALARVGIGAGSSLQRFEAKLLGW